MESKQKVQFDDWGKLLERNQMISRRMMRMELRPGPLG